MGRVSRRIGMFLLYGLLLFLCAEGILRVGGSWFMQWKYPQELVSFRKGSGTTITILTLGESSTGGLWVNPEDSYPSQLRRMLEAHDPSHHYRVIVPHHIGQNTSQMANRIDRYIDLYHPDLVILMAGVNNEWSLAESRVHRYLPFTGFEAFKIRAIIAVSHLRTYRILRYCTLAWLMQEHSEYVDQLEKQRYIWGGPELSRYPAASWIIGFAAGQEDAFVRSWREDMHIITTATKRARIPTLLMTYHLHQFYASPEEFVRFAAEEQIPLVRNDLVFRAFVEDSSIEKYVLHDHWHPNPKGYAVIARNAFNSILTHRLLLKKAK